MTEFKTGDIVRLSKGEPDKPGYEVRVRKVTPDGNGPGETYPGLLTMFEGTEWTIELISRPAPPLPTKPNALGWATVDGTRHLARLACGQWELYDTDGALGSVAHKSIIEDFTEAALIPKKLADKVMGWADDDHRRGWYTDGIMQQVADHLKGQDGE